MRDTKWHPHLSSLICSALCVVAALSASACSGIMLQSSASSDAQAEHAKLKAKLERSLKKQTVANRGLEEKLAKLQLQRLEKEAQLDDLNGRLEEAILEVVRAKAKLRSLGSKAEAASNLAEAEIAMKALEAKTAKGAKAPQTPRAQLLLRLGAKEFKKQNYSGALYLSGQAKSLIREGQEHSMSQEQLPLFPGEVAFVLPVPLRAQKTGNLRDGPGIKYKAVGKLGAGTQVLGHSYKGQWVRVRAEDGLTGWILYKLVNGQ